MYELETMIDYMKIVCHYPVPATIYSLQVTIMVSWVTFGSTTWKAVASNSVHQHTYIPIASSDI